MTDLHGTIAGRLLVLPRAAWTVGGLALLAAGLMAVLPEGRRNGAGGDGWTAPKSAEAAGDAAAKAEGDASGRNVPWLPKPAPVGDAGCIGCHRNIADPNHSVADLSEQFGTAERRQRRFTEAEKDEAAAKKAADEAREVRYRLVLLRANMRPLPHETAHPKLALYGADSAHGKAGVSCTACHGGDGSAKDFNGAGHRAKNAETAEKWAKTRGWKAPADDAPLSSAMLPASAIEASCVKCHTQVLDLPGSEAPKLNTAHRLVRDFACYACHTIDGFARDAAGKPTRAVGPDFTDESKYKRGPSLDNIHLKLGAAEIATWVRDPHAIRPTTKMPRPFDAAGGPDDKAKTDRLAAAAVAHYLLDGQFAAAGVEKAKTLPGWQDPPAPDPKGFTRPPEKDETFAQAGKRMFVEYGCIACHNYSGIPTTYKNPAATPAGPELTGLHHKLKGGPVAKKWLYNWLLAPEKYTPTTLMPNLRLAPQEALAIATFLLEPAASDHKGSDDAGPARPNAKPGADPFAKSAVSPEVTDADAETLRALAGGGDDVKALSGKELLAAAGKGVMRQYNCAACHNVQGVIATPPAPDLSADTPVAEKGRPVEWLRKKVLSPRSPDLAAKPGDKLLCPTYGFDDKQADALAVYLLGLRQPPPPVAQLAPRTPKAQSEVAAKGVMERMNCFGCHLVQTAEFTIRPMPTTGKKVERIDWLKLPDRVRLRAMPFSDLHDLHPLTAEQIVKAIEKDDMKELLTAVRVQLWRPAAHDAGLQSAFGAGLSEAEAETLERTHAVFLPADTAAKLAAYKGKHPFLELDAASAATALPLADIVGYRGPVGGYLTEGIYDYLAWAEARDGKASELAERVFGKDPKPEQIEAMVPLALKDPQARRPILAEKYLVYRAAPPLVGEGAKVQLAWLVEYLANPTRLRPMVILNMPRYNFRPGDIETIVRGFAASAGEDAAGAAAAPPERADGFVAGRVAKLFADKALTDDVAVWTVDGKGKTFAEFAKGSPDAAAGRVRGWVHVAERTLFSELAGNRCMNCHAWGDAPIAGTENADPKAPLNVNAGPNLILAHRRLKPDYLRKWLAAPAQVLPGTPMPANWGDQPHAKLDPVKDRMLKDSGGRGTPAERNRLQIESVIDLLMNPDLTAMSKTGAKHSVVWPKIVEETGLPPDPAPKK